MKPVVRKADPARLLDLAYDAIFAIEAETHLITYWNAGAERMYGYSAQEAVGQVSSRLLKTRSRDGLELAYQHVTRTSRWEGRLAQTRKDGTDVYVDAKWALDPTLRIVLEVNREVTEQIATAERFKLLVESVRDYAIYTLDNDGRVTSWNEGARRIKGYSDDEIMGRHFSVFYPPDDIAAGKPDMELKVAIKAGRLQDEGWRVRRDGSRFWATVVISALRDPLGQLSGFAKVTRDDTPKQMERERLLELERSKTTFLNLVAHELRSPLTVVRGYLSLIRDADDEGRRALEQRSLPVLEAKTMEMSRLVDQMVEVARLEEGTIRVRSERIDLGTLVEQVVEGARPLGEPTHRILFEAPAHELNVIGDDDRIRIILGNLLSNAIKYSPNGGDVTVTLDRLAASGRVTVSDRGVGIAPEDRPKLFKRFGRVESQRLNHVPGTGMGLYLSRELALLQRGELMLRSSGPQGSSFSLELPLAT